MRPGSKAEHDRIVREAVTLIGREAYQVARAFEHPTGRAYSEPHATYRDVIYGIDGSGDIYGWTLGGRLFFIEIKSGYAKQAHNQKKFQAMCEKWGVFYFVARSAQEALACVLRAAAA